MKKFNNKEIVLVENGKSLVSILVSDSPTNVEMEVARELKKYLERITKVEIPINTPVQEVNNILILIGSVNNKFDFVVPILTPESFRIQSEGRYIHIVGSDDDGLLFGIYTFLEEFCGVRWFWPGELGEVVPETNKLSIPEIDLHQSPDFKWRNRGPGGPLWGSFDRISMMKELGVSNRHLEEVTLWEKRNKIGGMKIYGGHAWGNIVPPAKYGKEHPEYFALVGGKRDADPEKFDGKHGAQLCTSNSELISIFTAYIDNFFRQHPEYEAIHITPNDGGKFCECERCRILDIGKRCKNNPDKPVITDRIFTFVNTVAEEVKKKHPGKYLVNMAYSWYRDPPERIKIDENVIAQYCLWSCYLHYDEKKRNEHYTIAKGWSDIAQNVAIYEYFINGAWPDLPRIVYTKIAESLRYLHGIGIKLYQTQAGDGFAVNGLNYYIASKLWWNINTDVGRLIDDFYQKAFGDAGLHIRKYYERLQNAWRSAVERGEHPSCSSFVNTNIQDVYPMELLEECKMDLERARKLTKDIIIKKRIGFIEKGLLYVMLTIKAVTLTKDLECRGIPIIVKTITDEEEIINLQNTEKRDTKLDNESMKLLSDAVQAWTIRDQYVESLKDDYVISYFWIKYNDENRFFNPIKRLREILKS